MLALGLLGFTALLASARRERAERARLVALLLGLGGQLAAVLAANLIVFTSAQNRMPLAIPLAFVSGPGLIALWDTVRPSGEAAARSGRVALGFALALFAQSFWPRLPPTDPRRPLLTDPRLWERYDVRAFQIGNQWFHLLQRADTVGDWQMDGLY